VVVFQELGIRHKFVKSGNRIEQANKSFQKKRTVDEMEGGGDEPDPKKTKGTFPPEKELR